MATANLISKLDLRDELDRKLEQARGIVALSRRFCAKDTDTSQADGDLSSALWSVENLLDECNEVLRKLDLATASQHT